MGRFKVLWKRNGPFLGHSVGIDCMSAEWGMLYKRLGGVSNKGFDCDFSNYDGNLRADFMRGAIEMIATVIEAGTSPSYSEGGITKSNIKSVLVTLLDECVETVQQSGDLVWMSLHGNPSGNPLTTELNCTVNMLYHWFCFRQILGDSVFDLRDFLSRVAFTSFGDDAIYTFKDVEQVTFEKMQYWMNFLGQDYTNAAKTQDDTELLDIHQLSFLKRTFKRSELGEAVVFSPIERDSILGQFNWCAYNQDAVDILQDTYENALLEMAQRGRKEFEEFVAQLHPVFDNHLKQITGIASPRPSYKGTGVKLRRRFVK
jgi:hypothetical protein